MNSGRCSQVILSFKNVKCSSANTQFFSELLNVSTSALPERIHVFPLGNLNRRRNFICLHCIRLYQILTNFVYFSFQIMCTDFQYYLKMALFSICISNKRIRQLIPAHLPRTLPRDQNNSSFLLSQENVKRLLLRLTTALSS